jgi:hypothetical protein
VRHQRETEWCLRALVPVGTCTRGRKSLNVVEKDGSSSDFASDERVKDRLGGWQDSESRKHIYQDRETQELRAEAANVRQRLRLGPSAVHLPHERHQLIGAGGLVRIAPVYGLTKTLVPPPGPRLDLAESTSQR